MSEQLVSFLALLIVHWNADFVLQTHWQASNKSKDNTALLRHVISYTIMLGLGSAVIFGVSESWFWFVALNGWLHFGTDYVTSRWTARFWAKKDYHNFFVMIGFDQLIHQFTLGLSMVQFFK